MLLALLLAAADGGSSLSFTDVRVGDQLVYDLGEHGVMTLRACEKSATTVAIAVSVERDGGVPNGTWLSDRMVVEQPVAPLETPNPWLGRKIREHLIQTADMRFPVCATFSIFHPTAHGASGEVQRCEARELILGGGLVSQNFSWLSHGSGLQHSVVKLKRVMTNKAPCPSWPRVKSTGGSSLVREGTSDSYLLDFLVKRIEDLPTQKPVPGTKKLKGREVKTLNVTGSNGHVWSWAAPGELADEPLGTRLRELGSYEPSK